MRDDEATSQRSGADQPESHAFLLRVAELLHAYGTPAYRLERVLQKVAQALSVEGAFLSTPTSVFVSLGSGPRKEVHLLRGESGEVNLGKLVEFDEVMEDVEHGRLRPGEAVARLDAIAEARSRYPRVVALLGYATACASAAHFFAGGAWEIALAFVLAAVTFLLARLVPRRPDVVGLYEPLAAFLVGFLALAFTRLVQPIDDRAVMLASLIVLLPGLTLTTGLTELAARHLVSGMARIAGAAAIFLTLLVGVALAWRVGEALLPAAGELMPAARLAPWTIWISVLVAPFAFAILFETRPREIPVVFVTSVFGYAAARAGATWLGADLGPFVGAFSIGLASNLYARWTNRPALVPLTPGILLLVPGSLGFRSLTSFLTEDALVGMRGAFETGIVAASLVGGLLAANVVLPPRRVL